MFGNRSSRRILRAIFGRQHYIALINMWKYYYNFCDNLVRYLTGNGKYPYEIELKTPTGTLKPTLYCHDDLLTVNEIFCRNDYPANAGTKTIVDLGSNIGISALYFLSRNDFCKCYLFEPDKRNIEKLKMNLKGYESRYFLEEAAVSYEAGQLNFGIESTGRYGGIGLKMDEQIIVDCLNINDVLNKILEKEDYIDILKIDTEGIEQQTVKAIESTLLDRIKYIYIESHPDHELFPGKFYQKQYGSVCQFENRLNQQLYDREN